MNTGTQMVRENPPKLIHAQLTKEIIGAAIEVHRHLGPGLLESAYEVCPVLYKGVSLNCGYKIDILVDEKIVLELKSVEAILPVHEAQLMTYLRLSEKRLGFLMNFHVSRMTAGIKRRVL